MVAGSGLLMYLLCALVVPERPEEPFRSFYDDMHESGEPLCKDETRD